MFSDGCVLGVFVVCTIVQAGSSVCTHRQVGPERRRGRGGQCRAVLGTTSTLVLPHKDQLHNNQALISGVSLPTCFMNAMNEFMVRVASTLTVTED